MSGGARSNGVSAGAQAQIEDLTTQVLLIHVAFGNFYLSLFLNIFAYPGTGWLSSPVNFSGKPH